MRSLLAMVATLLVSCCCNPNATAAELIVKSRAVPAGSQVSVPMIVDAVSQNKLWGIEFAIVTDRLRLFIEDHATAFVPFNRQSQDFVFSGDPYISEGKQYGRPTLYVTYVRWGGYVVQPVAQNTTALGAVKLSTSGSALLSDEYDVGIYSYYHKPYEPGVRTLRAGASGATSSSTSGVGAREETVTISATMPYRFTPAKLNPTDSDPVAVPLHQIVIGRPGDVNNDGRIDLKDYALLYKAWKHPAARTTRILVTGDIAPLNGYTTTNPLGTNGVGYGDGFIDGRDLAALGDYINRDRTMNGEEYVTFPVPE